ncbi:GTPase-associated system all-helical protein GASH [Sorangium sp. So ce1182]|uniref:GTPase-associated system all-helical protein GASH n=1 Tax=Sorangium sp. So ce1182 TaxID=3133334 RepID=UPI003F5E322D
MHKNFGEWYRLVSIEPNGDSLTRRWAGVEEWASTLRGDDNSIMETVRIFHGLHAKSSRDAFLEAFRKHDPAFPQRNELELRVLAGASLVACVHRSNGDEDDGVHAAFVVGLAVGASSLRVTGHQLTEVIDEVLTCLQTVARDQRRRALFDTSLLGTKADTAALEAMKQISSASDWSQLRMHVAPVLQSLLDETRRSERALAAAAHNLRRVNEENDILWWLEGACSRDLKKPWSALSKDAVPLIAAKELADLTDVALGPQDAAALLHRVVTNARCKETSIQVYVNAASEEWASTRGAEMEEGVLDLAPLSLALSHRGKTTSSSWQQYFEASSGVRAATSLAPDRVALQMYHEAVLLRTLADTEN